MKSYFNFIIVLVFTYLVCVAVAQKKAVTQDEKVALLSDWMLRRPVIRLNGDKFRTYVRSPPRNYSIIMMLTAMSPQRQCHICKAAYEEYEIVANSYRYSFLYSKKMYFTMVDFDEGSDIFQSLQLSSAPVIMHFPAKGKPKRADTMDISRVGFHAESISRWIYERTDVQIRVLRPPNYAGPLLFILVAMLVGGLLYMRRNNLEFLYNRTSWGIAALCVIFAFLSGQMWNHIRGPPLMHRNPNTGQMSYIQSSSQGQFIIETYIVFGMYAAITAGFIIMNDAADATKEEPTKRRIKACVGLGLIVLFFSLILSIFRQKYQGYPYSFLLK